MTLACRCGAAGGDSVSDEIVVNDTAAGIGMDGRKGSVFVVERGPAVGIGLVWDEARQPKDLGKFTK
jgi:hypothetical protein